MRQQTEIILGKNYLWKDGKTKHQNKIDNQSVKSDFFLLISISFFTSRLIAVVGRRQKKEKKHNSETDRYVTTIYNNNSKQKSFNKYGKKDEHKT